MQKLTYKTGRTYDGAQVLEIEILQSETDEFGLMFGKALFVDRARSIAGTVDFFAASDSASDIGRGVLREYDTGEYGAVVFSSVA